MNTVDFTIELDNRVRDIEYCRIDNIKFEPLQNRRSFTFKEGKWIAEHKKFPVPDDNDLDIMIIVTGNPGTTCELKITFTKSGRVVTLEPYKPFAQNGRSFFSEEIKLNP